MTMASQIKLDKPYNLIIYRTGLGASLDIKPVPKFEKSLTKTSGKVQKPKTYNRAISKEQ